MGTFAARFESVEPSTSQPIRIRPHVPEGGDFPVDALSSKLQAATRAIIDKTQAPPAVCAQSVIGAAVLGVQPYFDVILPTGDQVPTSLFLATVAASGERKTGADKQALWSVREREAEMGPAHREDMVSYLADAAAYAAARKKAQSGSKSRNQMREELEACGTEPIAPPTPLLITDDFTLAGLQRLFVEAMPSLGLYSDEGGQVLVGHAMQEENRIATGAALSKLWDGSPIKRVRAGDGVTILRGRRLSSHLMIQGRIATRLFGDPDLASQGLLSRILPCYPKSTIGDRPWRETDPDSDVRLEAFQARLLNLLRAPFPMDPVTRELRPRPIPLSDDARKLFISWHDAVETDLRKGGKFEKIRGFAAKLPEHSVRLAAVMACFENRNIETVSAQALASGIRLAQFYASEALRLFGVGSSDEDTEAADLIIKWVREQSLVVVGKRQLSRHGPGREMNLKLRERALELLVQSRNLVEIPGGAEVAYKGKTEFNRDAYTVIADTEEAA